MSDRPLTKSANAETPKQSSVKEESSSKKPVPVPRWSEASRWSAYAALAYFHPAHNSASVPQQGGDAKANVCSAFASTRKAVVINTHMQSPNINDRAAELSVATNARLALIGGGAYLRERLAANTAAPADLANAADSLANTVQQLGINYLTQAGNDVQDPIRKDLNNELTQIDKMCT